MTSDAVRLARRDLDRFEDGPAVANLTQATERVIELPEFAIMAEAASSYRPQWAGPLDALYEKPLLVSARRALHNAFTATLRRETLYYNAFGALVDAVIIWRYAYTQERAGDARISAIHDTLVRLLRRRERFLEPGDDSIPDDTFFEALKHVRLSKGRGYALIRTVGRYLAALEGEATERKVSTLRGTVMMSLAVFSGQVLAMSAAVQDNRSAISLPDAAGGLAAYLQLLQTHPSLLLRAPAG
jgi:hypothetical protein